MESKKRRAQEERSTLRKAQEVNFASEFKAADRAARRSNEK
ncbi:YfhE family protein [Bacillus suaedae]|uniref:YfhE family protein n=1 Tax=Halalkalibacter suaedae TaxID=2822140 RepID=A0A940WXE0_9BACI|nr:YfhE family protein [Bacillus suaedae]MBP3952372.1 YfhE family protein [Bacillus suaedae]